MINLLNLVGVIALSSALSISNTHQTYAIDSMFYYNVSRNLDSNDNLKSISGNFEFNEYTWGYDLPNLVTSQSSGIQNVSAFTLFKEDSVYFSNAYVQTDKLFPNDLFNELSNAGDYYAGYLDLFAIDNTKLSYWQRIGLIGNLSLNSYFELTILNSLPSSSQSNEFYSFYVPFDDTLLNATGNNDNYEYFFVDNKYYFRDISYYKNQHAGSIPLIDYVLVSNTYPVFYGGTSGVPLRIYPEMCVYLGYVPTSYSYTPSSSVAVTYSSNISDYYTNSLRTPYSSFTCKYDYTSYSETINYNDGYNAGKQEGYEVGTNEGFNNGYQEGYSAGFQEADNQDSVALTIFTGIINVGLLPVNMFLNIFNFEVFGINIGALVSSFLTIAVVIIIWRIISGSGNKND